MEDVVHSCIKPTSVTQNCVALIAGSGRWLCNMKHILFDVHGIGRARSQRLGPNHRNPPNGFLTFDKRNAPCISRYHSFVTPPGSRNTTVGPGKELWTSEATLDNSKTRSRLLAGDLRPCSEGRRGS